MLYTPGSLRTLWFATAFAVTSATSLPPGWLFERAGICAANFSQCTQAGLPANFCCSQGTTCNVLAGATTVLCCPTGSDCSTIRIINCELSLQDPVAHPSAGVKTTDLNGKLPTCGKGCCPFGYHCDESTTDCVIDSDQSKKPGETSPSSSSAPSPTSVAGTISTAGTTHTGTAATTSATTTPTATPASLTAASSGEKHTSQAAQTLDTAAIVGGVVGGIAFLALLAAGIWVVRYRRKKADGEGKKHDSSPSFADKISAPIPHADYYAERLDFLAKAQSSSIAASPAPTPGIGGISERLFSPNSPYSASAFRRDSEMTDRPRSYHHSAEVGGLRNLTDRNLTDRYSGGSRAVSNPFSSPRSERMNSGGSESINIFADPTAVRSHDSLSSTSSYDRRQTTWTEFQQHADEKRIPDLPNRR
ncbi:hypothetical protein GGR50DRAFT_186334 [Xylaria sp. CBS 124048]|nr:hypothetical protein GGR50DRAFT_186334 [Xylaria sp. CBS 124048]